MPIFKLKKENHTIENAVLVPASKTSLELEKHLEGWLENSPWAIAQEPLLIIGRQTTATTDEYGTIKPVKQVVWESIRGFTKNDTTKIFSQKDICQIVLNKYPNFNKSTVGCQIISDSVNHTSRHHYPGGEDRYWWNEKGKYKLYDPTTDK